MHVHACMDVYSRRRIEDALVLPSALSLIAGNERNDDASLLAARPMMHGPSCACSRLACPIQEHSSFLGGLRRMRTGRCSRLAFPILDAAGRSGACNAAIGLNQDQVVLPRVELNFVSRPRHRSTRIGQATNRTKHPISLQFCRCGGVTWINRS